MNEITQSVIAELSTLHTPRDVQSAYRIYGATCGPCAFAALLEKEIPEIIHLFPQFPQKQFTNLPSMKSALRASGIPWIDTDTFPSVGLTLISGPERYYSRHWVAVRGDCLYDVNLEMWMPIVLWCRDVLPAIARVDKWKNDEWQIVRSLSIKDSRCSLEAVTPQFDRFL